MSYFFFNSGFGARDGGLTVLRTCNRPDVVVTMGVKAGCRGVWSLGSSVEDEDDEDDEEDVLLFGELLWRVVEREKESWINKEKHKIISFNID